MKALVKHVSYIMYYAIWNCLNQTHCKVSVERLGERWNVTKCVLSILILHIFGDRTYQALLMLVLLGAWKRLCIAMYRLCLQLKGPESDEQTLQAGSLQRSFAKSASLLRSTRVVVYSFKTRWDRRGSGTRQTAYTRSTDALSCRPDVNSSHSHEMRS